MTKDMEKWSYGNPRGRTVGRLLVFREPLSSLNSKLIGCRSCGVWPSRCAHHLYLLPSERMLQTRNFWFLNKASYRDTFSMSIGLTFEPPPKLSLASPVSISQTMLNKLFNNVHFLKTNQIYMRNYVEQMRSSLGPSCLGVNKLCGLSQT